MRARIARMDHLRYPVGRFAVDRQLTADLQRIYQWKVGEESSYRLWLENGDLRWQDGSVKPPRIWTQEPNADWKRRTMATVVRWLPVESQL